MMLKESLNDLRRHRYLVFAIFVFCMMATFSFLAARGIHRSSAATTSGFNPGNIISDAVMANYNSMSVDDIQNFLTSKNRCTNTNYNQYLNLKAVYPNTDWHFENGHFVCLSEERFGDGVEIGAGQTAAEIIYQAAQDYRINPQVIIVLLEKEQSLITDNYPNSNQYRSATGYGCPDTDVCNSKYYGFKNQVRNAAALFRDVLDRGYSVYPEKTKGVYIGYHPNSACGRSEVYIENRATAALYRYTPYQPNTSALAAGYGTGDGCSAYGNRNFYLYFTDWFGSTQLNVDGTPTYIPDGIYGLSAANNPQEVMEVAGSSTQNGANIQIWDRNTSASQKWIFKRNLQTGYYTITDAKSGKLLDLSGANTNLGTNISLWQETGSCAQQWKVYQTPDNYLTFESVCMAGMVLDLSGGYSTSGTNIQLWESNNTYSQKWSIYTGPSVQSGTYIINSGVADGKVIDLSNAQPHSGTNIQIWDYDSRTIAQKWTLTYHSDGDYYTITNPGSNKVADVDNGRISSGTNIQQWDSNQSNAQRWKIIKTLDNQYTITLAVNPSQVVDVFGGYSTNGTNVQTWDTNNSSAQKWTFTEAPAIEDGVYNLMSKLSPDNRTVDVSGGYTTTGTNIQLWEYNGTAAQEWQITYNWNNGSYSLRNPVSGKYLTLASTQARYNENVQLGEGTSNCAVYWDIVKNNDGSVTLFSTCNREMALDVSTGSINLGTNIQLWESNLLNSQKWYLRRRY